MAGDVLLEIEDLDLFYGKSQALDGVSLHVDEGEIVSVIGPNGAGKTTMLNAISGLVDYDGTIRFKGEDLGERTEREVV